MPMSFEAVVIGAGSGGLTAARRLALAGKRTALVEADRLGGDCLNWGCVPTKTLISSVQLLHQIGRGASPRIFDWRPPASLPPETPGSDDIVIIDVENIDRHAATRRDPHNGYPVR